MQDASSAHFLKVRAPGRFYAWYVVFILILAYTVSYIDRTILTLMVDPIRKSLQISDLQISLLHGLAFALFYTVMGLPIGRLVDRRKRTSIIASGMLLWSLMTMICGTARSFGQLFLARVGVGVGEAALAPAAYSMLSDYFEPRHLTRALSVYTGAIYIGAGIAMIAGGAIVSLVPALTLPLVGVIEPWQLVFMIVGLPGFVVAMLVVSLKEPKRKGLSQCGEVPSIGAVGRYVSDRRGAYGLLILGFSASSMMWNGVSAWVPTYFIRTFAWSPATVGLWFGISLLLFGTSGIVSGGWLAARMREHGHTDANLRVGIISAVASMGTGVVAPLVPDANLSMMMFCLFIFAASMPYGAAAAALQEITPNQMRGQISALYLLGLNLCGIGLGPAVVALFTDDLFQSDDMIRYSLVLMVAVGALFSTIILTLAVRPYRRVLETANF